MAKKENNNDKAKELVRKSLIKQGYRILSKKEIQELMKKKQAKKKKK